MKVDSASGFLVGSTPKNQLVAALKIKWSKKLMQKADVASGVLGGSTPRDQSDAAVKRAMGLGDRVADEAVR